MYRDELLDLYKNPLNHGALEDADLEKEGENPSCGDHLKLYVNSSKGIISEIKHETDACAICTAAASLTTENVRGESVEKVLQLDKDWVLNKLETDVSPMRMKCALLCLKTLQAGLNDIEME